MPIGRPLGKGNGRGTGWLLATQDTSRAPCVKLLFKHARGTLRRAEIRNYETQLVGLLPRIHRRSRLASGGEAGAVPNCVRFLMLSEAKWSNAEGCHERKNDNRAGESRRSCRCKTSPPIRSLWFSEAARRYTTNNIGGLAAGLAGRRRRPCRRRAGSGAAAPKPMTRQGQADSTLQINDTMRRQLLLRWGMSSRRNAAAVAEQAGSSRRRSESIKMCRAGRYGRRLSSKPARYAGDVSRIRCVEPAVTDGGCRTSRL